MVCNSKIKDKMQMDISTANATGYNVNHLCNNSNQLKSHKEATIRESSLSDHSFYYKKPDIATY